MAYTTVDNPELYFQTKLWTGNGSTGTGQTGVGFQPDWVWIKARAGTQGTQSNNLFDSVRGEGKYLFSDSNDAESTDTNRLTSFDSDGFTVGSNNAVNASSTTYVAWNWKAGTSFSNSAGANGADLASSGSYNRTAGFSIVTFTGNATDDQQIYHGLNSVPQMMILKNRTNGNNESWKVYHQAIGNTHALTLDTNAAASSNTEFWSDENPTSTVFTVGRQDATNGSGNTHVVYCFSEIKGYSKFGSYTGNGNSNGAFVYTGFRPAFIIIKNTARSDNWYLFDNKRGGFNVDNDFVFPDLSNAEVTSDQIDILSNGFKCRSGNDAINSSGESIIYMTFAESPFVNSAGAVPNNAR